MTEIDKSLLFDRACGVDTFTLVFDGYKGGNKIVYYGARKVDYSFILFGHLPEENDIGCDNSENELRSFLESDNPKVYPGWLDTETLFPTAMMKFDGDIKTLEASPAEKWPKKFALKLDPDFAIKTGVKASVIFVNLEQSNSFFVVYSRRYDSFDGPRADELDSYPVRNIIFNSIAYGIEEQVHIVNAKMPKNNDGLTQCAWCSAPTRDFGAVHGGIAMGKVCTKCGK
jgi:hypothetical protein